ncbi:enoyl-CoA hydratase family protein [Corallococcus sp. AB004]|uniref:enoyl-CoA hydratase family protein n=1 Tax=Corallococcus TaxID=83461 RepID=UPI000EA26A65|nr:MULTISPECIES: enoyl-CoA hydratase family protein [Corallococcus]NPC69264.1 enoyl-CoA hydratase family protein [Corallococcus exiguus]NRD43521.1 enoyl-CoA hydratase family protein [Corallococcus exiguus]RKI01192.1 enoyl-CoA hydratase family protein [Corallococcus sp. AB038B]RKI48650.1 enoyl-CoA hydratase family protein [Corallococcus sp. AB004]
MSEAPLVRYEVSRGVATLTLDSPRNRNALSRALVTQLLERLNAVGADSSVRAVVLAATGPAFCAGADLSEMADGGAAKAPGVLLDVLRTIVTLPQPVVAKVAGQVRAGGIGIVGACDVAVVAESVKFAFTEARIGVTPAVISLTTLPHLTSRAASRYFLTGEAFDAAEAARIGLVTTAVPDASLDGAVEQILETFRVSSPQGLRETKQLVSAGLRARIDAGGAEMVALSGRLFASEEAQEGMLAFLERRPPAWAAPK